MSGNNDSNIDHRHHASKCRLDQGSKTPLINDRLVVRAVLETPAIDEAPRPIKARRSGIYYNEVPLFSVIIPTFNRARLCRAAVDSVLQQNSRDFELIVVDDGSTDGTVEALAEDNRGFRLLRQRNSGQSIARNTGIAAANGDYVAFLDSDDQWLPWTLATLCRAIVEGEKPTIIAGRNVPFWEQFPDLDAINKPFAMRRFEDALDFYSHSRPVVLDTGVLVIRTDALKKAGGFTATRDNAEDVDLCLRLANAPGFVRLESPPLFAKLSHANSIGLALGLSASGLQEIFKRERLGVYPGSGGRNKRARLELISAGARNTIYLAARQGQIRRAWSLYRQCVLWNFQLGRLKFVFGLPALALVGFIRSRAAGVRQSMS